MQFIGLSSTLIAAIVMQMLTGRLQLIGVETAPAEGLTPYGFFMARPYGQPANQPVMNFIAFKPSDGAKFRESFEKKHGPRGRDLIDSLGSGSYKPTTEKNTQIATAGSSSSKSSKSLKTMKPLVSSQHSKQL